MNTEFPDIISRDGKHHGRFTGGQCRCQMEGCTGRKIAVRWNDGKLTFPCSKGMQWNNKKMIFKML